MTVGPQGHISSPSLRNVESVTPKGILLQFILNAIDYTIVEDLDIKVPESPVHLRLQSGLQ
jgi:hypothetical protein